MLCDAVEQQNGANDIVGEVTGLWTGQSGTGFPARERDFSPEHPDWLWGFLIQWVPEALFAG